MSHYLLFLWTTYYWSFGKMVEGSILALLLVLHKRFNSWHDCLSIKWGCCSVLKLLHLLVVLEPVKLDTVATEAATRDNQTTGSELSVTLSVTLCGRPKTAPQICKPVLQMSSIHFRNRISYPLPEHARVI